MALLLAAPSAARDVVLDRERYYDDEAVHARLAEGGGGGARWIWSMLGKELKAAEEPSFRLSEPLRAPAPLDVSAGAASRRVGLFPRSAGYYWQAGEAAGKKIGLYDPREAVSGEMKALGAAFVPLAGPEDAQLWIGDLLVLGPRLEGADWRVLDAVVPRVEKGLRVLVLEQEALPEEPPFSLALVGEELSPRALSSFRFPAEVVAPSRWGASEYCAHFFLTVPADRPHRVLVPAQTRDEAPGAPALVVRFPLGKGAITFCQVDLSRHFQDEPLARWILAHLIRESLAAKE